jgi:hypothetical protein
MPEARDWTIELDTNFTELDSDRLVDFIDELERGYGYMGPSAALHDGRLGVTVTVAAAKPEIALLAAFAAISGALDNLGFRPDVRVEVERVNMEFAEKRELVLA